MQILRENGLILNINKYKFFRSEVEFLGLRVTAGGVALVLLATMAKGHTFLK